MPQERAGPPCSAAQVVHSTIPGGSTDTDYSRNGISGTVRFLTLTTRHGEGNFEISMYIFLGSEINKNKIRFYP